MGLMVLSAIQKLIMLFFSDPLRDMTKRKTWTPEEKEACIKNFSKNIAIGFLPGKTKIEAIQKTDPVLMERTWLQIKNFIRNYIKKHMA